MNLEARNPGKGNSVAPSWLHGFPIFLIIFAFLLPPSAFSATLSVDANGNVLNSTPTNFPTGKLKVNGVVITGSAAGVTSVTGTPPIVSSGGTTPALSITAATTSAPGSMSAADKTKLNAITGTNTGDQIVPSTSSATSSFFLNSYNAATGAFTKTQPTFTDLAAHPTTLAGYGITDAFFVTSRTIFVDATIGNDGTGTRGRRDKPFLTILAALSATGISSGDVISVGPGTFTPASKLQLPSGVSLYGAGMGVTVIQASFASTILAPGSNSVIADLTVQATNLSGGSFQFPLGADTADNAFSNVLVLRCKLIGGTDAFYFNQNSAGTDSLTAYDCIVQSQWDCVYSGESGGVFKFYNCDFISTGGNPNSLNSARAINVSSGTVKIFGGTITVSGGTSANKSVVAAGSSAAVQLHNTVVTTSATGTNGDLFQSSSSTISIDNVSRGDGTALVTSGTITGVGGWFASLGLGGAATVRKFEVYGSSNTALMRLIGGGTVITEMGSLDTQGIGYIGTFSNHDLQIQTNNATVAAFTAGGDFGLGLGSNSPSARFHVVSATEQLRIGYNLTNYYKTTVSSTGGVTFDAVGSGAGFTFADPVTITNGSIAGAALANDAVTYAKMQNVSATSRILGRKTSGAGDTEELTLSEVLDFISSAAPGDILYRDAGTWKRLPGGSEGQVLTSHVDGLTQLPPSWETPSGGGSGGVIGTAGWDGGSNEASADVRGIVQSVTYVSPGKYVISFASAQPDEFYTASFACDPSFFPLFKTEEWGVNGFILHIADPSTAGTDANKIRVTIFRLP